METSLLHISVYYASARWHILLKHLHALLSQHSEQIKGYVLFLDKQKGDAIKLALCLNSANKEAVKLSVENATVSFLLAFPSVRSKKDFVPGEYLWKITPNNTIGFGYFSLGVGYIDQQNQSFSNTSLYRFAHGVSKFLLDTPVNNANIIDVFSFQLLLAIRVFEVTNTSIFSGLVELVEERSEFRQQAEQLQKIYAHSAEDLPDNWENINEFINTGVASLDLEPHEMEFFNILTNITKATESPATSTFNTFVTILIRHLGIDYRKQLYVLKMFELYYQGLEKQNNRAILI